MFDLRLALRRIKFSLALNLIILISMGVSVLVISSFPIYLDSLDRQSFRSELAKYMADHSEAELNTNITYPFLSLTNHDIKKSDGFVRDAFESSFQVSNVDLQRQIKTGLFEFDISPGLFAFPSGGMISPTNQGYFLNISEINDHVIYSEGGVLLKSEDSSYIPVAVESRVAQEFGFQIGSVFTAVPAFGSNIQTHASQPGRLFNTASGGDEILVKIVDVFKPRDTNDPFWRGNINEYMMPYPAMETGIGLFRDGIGIRSQDVRPYIVLIADKDVLIKQLGKRYSSAVSEGSWNMVVGSKFARNKSRISLSNSLSELSNEITLVLPGSSVDSALNVVLNKSKRQRLSTDIPLLILSSIMVLGIYIFIFIASIYVVRNRSQDSLLMWSRGFPLKTPALYYLSEGLIFLVVCVTAVPFLSVLLVSLIGLIPPFNVVTDNELLPVRIFIDPFLYAAVSGGLNLLVYISAGLIGWNSKVKSYKYDDTRTRQKPFFQRYYLDYALLICSLILIWEMKLNTGLVTSSQKGNREVNEFLLISPVIFLLSVSLIFFRIFPHVIRLISGESKLLIYCVGYLLVIVLGITILINIFANDGTQWEFVIASILLLTLSLILFATRPDIRFEIAAASLAVVSLVVLIIFEPDKVKGFTFELYWVFYAIPSMMMIFLLARQSFSRAPLWFFLVSRNFSRNSGQYIWIIILLAISSGILVFGTTLSLTIGRSMEERILHQIGADGRVISSPDQFYRSNYSLEKHRKKLMANAEVESVTRVMRTAAKTGSTESGYKFDLLALDTASNIPWSRNDFSTQPIGLELDKLIFPNEAISIGIPISATHIGANLKFDSNYPNVTTKFGLIQGDGQSVNLSLGTVRDDGWVRAITKLPDGLTSPLKLSSIHFVEPGFGPSGTSGTIVISDVFAVVGGAEVLIEDFEEFGNWAIIPSSELSSDNMTILKNGSVEFNFGKHTNAGVRGMYWAEVGEFIPAVASDEFLTQTSLSIGDFSLIKIKNFVVIVKIVDNIGMFATLPADGNGFLLTDLDMTLFHLKLTNPLSSNLVNELLFTLHSDDVVSGDFRENIFLRGSNLLLVHEEITHMEKDVFFSIGLKALIFSIIAITFFMACMGHLIHIICNYRVSQSYSGSLRMVGMSKIQLFTNSLMENLLVVLLGSVIGFWAGLEMCRYVISSVIVSAKGLPVTPPPIMSVDWFYIGIVFSFFILVVTMISVITAWKSSTSNLGVLSRAE